MSVSRMLRSMVSKDSNRFKEGEFDLDLTYITPRIIGMGFPASGMEGMYRNHIYDVSLFLNQRHNGQYMIWNLSGRPYDYSLFDNQVLEFGFPDHHSPPLLLLIKTVLSIHKWLSSSPENIAVVHCLAGKGRTGTVIACYLLYSGHFLDPKDALFHYGSTRSEINKGVSYPSQLRYVEYFKRICFGIKQYYPRYLKITRVTMGPFVRVKPILEIYSYKSSKATEDGGLCVTEDLIYPQNPLDLPMGQLTENNYYVFQMDQMVEGDIVIRCFGINWLMTKYVIFRSCFNTLLVDQNQLVLRKEDLDLAEKDPKFPKDFKLVIDFTDDFEPPENKFDNSLYSQFFLEAKECTEKSTIPLYNNANKSNSRNSSRSNSNSDLDLDQWPDDPIDCSDIPLDVFRVINDCDNNNHNDNNNNNNNSSNEINKITMTENKDENKEDNSEGNEENKEDNNLINNNNNNNVEIENKKVKNEEKKEEIDESKIAAVMDLVDFIMI